MENKEYAKECGLRLRRVRMAKNMSQQDLADKMFTTPQNVSKWEKEGIRDIDTIKNLSQILGQDLLSDERNEEGIVGEIGKHILKKIAENGGFLPVTDLIEEHMFGLKSEIVTEEIFKLEKIGMCVREQYKNFYDEEKDMLFLTAKGLITLNNFSVFGNVVSKTYEQFLAGRNTIQEYYDENKAEKLIRNLPFYGVYRIDYINYLYKNHTAIYIDDKEEFIPMLPGEDFQTDLLFRMITGLDEYRLWTIIMELNGFEAEDEEERYNELLVLENQLFGSEIPYIDRKLGEMSEKIKLWNENINAKNNSDADYPFEEDAKKRYAELCEDGYFLEEDVDYFIERRNAFVEGKYTSEWFSLEEIKNFIKENFTETEQSQYKHIDKVLAKINKLEPSSLDYYRCPREWKEAGIEKMIKSFYYLNTDDESEGDE